jgi:sugar lactone lactonase YvrE
VIETVDAALLYDARAKLGEAPFWDAQRSELIWVDIHRHCLHFTSHDGVTDREVIVDGPVSAVVRDHRSGLLVACGRHVARCDEQTGRLDVLATVGVPEHGRLNEGKCDPAGRFWVGGVTLTEGDETALYRVGADHVAATVLPRIRVSNGMAWSADGSVMYYIDSATQAVDAFAFDVDSGTLGNRRHHVEIPATIGIPDGMTVDADGGLWVALFHGGVVHRYDSNRVLTHICRLPVPGVTSCAFGGIDHRSLFITTAQDYVTPPVGAFAGGVFVCEPGPRGVAPSRYAG